MKMVTEDYASFETAKLLKEKGFESDNCHTAYDENGSFFWYGDYSKDRKGIMDAPTLQMVMKWLREKYNYQIIATPEYGDMEYMPGQWQEEFLGWKYTIIPFNGNKSIMHPSVYSITAESAYEAAIKYCLENLI
jgi:hypothetical protein